MQYAGQSFTSQGFFSGISFTSQGFIEENFQKVQLSFVLNFRYHITFATQQQSVFFQSDQYKNHNIL